jgi:hypothetical protein
MIRTRWLAWMTRFYGVGVMYETGGLAMLLAAVLAYGAGHLLDLRELGYSERDLGCRA